MIGALVREERESLSLYMSIISYPLVNVLSVEWNSKRVEKESGVFVCSGGRVDSDVASGDHLRRVPERKEKTSMLVHVTGVL